MIAESQLAFGRRVVWQGHIAEVMDIQQPRRPGQWPRVQIRVLELAGRPVRWASLAELVEVSANQTARSS